MNIHCEIASGITTNTLNSKTGGSTWEKEKKKNLLKQVLRPFSKLFATDYMCCTEYAGRWLFGDKIFNKGKVNILNNAIDLDKFKYNEELRKQNSNVKISALCPGPIKTPFLEKANVKFKTKVMTSTDVANYAIDKMFEGKYMILPGANNKMIRFLSKIVPDKTIGKIVYNMEEAKR